MMRGKKHFAVACRRVNGEIATTSEPVEAGLLGRLKWLNRPFLRGTLAMIDTLALGMKSLMWSANVAMEDEQARTSAEPPPMAGQTSAARPAAVAAADPPAPAASRKVNDVVLSLTMFLAVGLAILVFLFAPSMFSKLIVGADPKRFLERGLIEGGFKLTFFLLYIWGISHMKDIRRVFQYHGGEHKVINAFEAGENLNVENVRKHTTVHVRCGTSFLLVVILVSIIVFIGLPWDNLIIRLAYKLLLLPVVAGIAYEVIKLAGTRKRSKLVKLILTPGLLMQRITTQEPSDDQIEVAIRSFQCMREAEATES